MIEKLRNQKIKAFALLSGGLDSILAARLIMEQGIECVGIYFTTPFWSNNDKEKTFLKNIEVENNIKIIVKPIVTDFIKLVKNPKHGWGKNINPCIDCKTYMLKTAKKIMEQNGGSFLITGEVLGQRPMSQNKNSFSIIEKEAEVVGILLKPLSAKLRPETIAEKNGWVDREKLLSIKGRSRVTQFKLARQYGITTYTSPAGGCLLTDKVFAKKLYDLYRHKETITKNDIELLKVGRHFRFGENKIIVGRNETENRLILEIKDKNDYLFEVPNTGSPDTILQGEKNELMIKTAAKLTALYSASTDANVLVKYGTQLNDLSNEIEVAPFTREEANSFNLSFKKIKLEPI